MHECVTDWSGCIVGSQLLKGMTLGHSPGKPKSFSGFLPPCGSGDGTPPSNIAYPATSVPAA